MKRFAVLFSACVLLLAVHIAGCGNDGVPGGGTKVDLNADQSNWGEAKKYEAKIQKKLDAGESLYAKKKP